MVGSFGVSVEIEFADERGGILGEGDETPAEVVSSAGDDEDKSFEVDPWAAAEDSCVVVVGEVLSSLTCEVLVLVLAPILFSGLGGAGARAGALTSFSITSASVFD